MPDLDKISRTLSPPYREAYRLLKGGHSSEAVAESLIRALAASIRNDGGLLGLERIWSSYSEARPGPGGATTLADMTRAVEQDFFQRTPVKLMARVARSSWAAGEALLGPQPLIEGYLTALLRHAFFGRIMVRLVGRSPFTNRQQGSAFIDEVKLRMAPQLEEMARRLAFDPAAQHLRAPKSQRRKKSTKELLEAPVSLGR